MEFSFSNKLSAKSRYWKLREHNDAYVSSAMQAHGVSNMIARLLYNKSILLEEIPDFLEPKLKNLLPDPFCLKDMDKAVRRIAEAVTAGQNIAIYGDYDVDGATATALLTRYLRKLGATPAIYIPDRMKEGYGVNTEALLKLHTDKANLVITVDCGITAFEPILAAKNAGLDIVVVDHHLSSDTFPEAVAIVNPNRFDDTSGLNNLCAAGVCFILCIALNRHLRETGFFNGKAEPNLFELLDLVALGTVCDVMTLTGLNRAFVTQGLKILAQRKNLGLAHLSDIAGNSKKADVYTLGFLLGPRINAAGRISDCSLGASLLISEDGDFVKETALSLHSLNHERQNIEKKILEEAVAQAEKQNDQSSPLTLVYSDKWHPGVIGIVAGRLKELYNKPAAVIALKDNEGRASARSVSGIDFGSAIANAKNAGLLLAGGGHKAAAGFTVAKDKIDELYRFLCSQFEGPYNKYCDEKHVHADIVIKVSSANVELLNEMEKLGPFGNGNSEPVVLIDDAKIVKIKWAADKHMQAYISESGLARNSATIKAVCFNCYGTELGERFEASLMKNASLLGKLRKNIWNGTESVEFHIDDIIVY